jgi:uncharacterized membrane-anchored protein
MIARILSLPYPLRVVVTTALLSAILAWIVWDRVSLLRTGTEIVLKTRPIDPRSLFRGHYVRLEYDVGLIKTDRVKVTGEFKRHDPIFVRLKSGPGGYWIAVSAQKTPPRKNSGLYLAGSVRGARVVLEQDIQRDRLRRKLQSCTDPLCRRMARAALVRLGKQPRRIKQCGATACQSLRVHYGLERYFAQKQRARALEKKRAKQALAVLVRVSPFGIGAISGLMIDGKKIFDEPLF